jgi:hypothetical protein
MKTPTRSSNVQILKAGSPVVLLFSALLAWSAICLPASAIEVLRGVIFARIIDDHCYIPPGVSCTLVGTVIKGDLSMDKGAQLTATRATITGNLVSLIGGKVDLKQSTTVNGSVQVGRFRSVTIQGGTLVKGDVYMTSTTVPVDIRAVLVKDSTIWGALGVIKITGETRIVNNKIHKDCSVLENKRGSHTVQSNLIRGHLYHIQNRGGGSVTGNTVKKTMTVTKNTPRPKVKNNTVTGTVTVD